MKFSGTKNLGTLFKLLEQLLEVTPLHFTCTIQKTHRGRSRATATSKMERFVVIVNGFQPLTIITKRSILDVAVALDLPLTHKYLLISLIQYPYCPTVQS